MRTEFRFTVQLIEEGGEVIATVIDVPEAMTFGEDAEHAGHEAEDALLVALSPYMDRHEAVPMPSKAARGRSCVPLHPLAAAKVSLHNAMLAADETNMSLVRVA